MILASITPIPSQDARSMQFRLEKKHSTICTMLKVHVKSAHPTQKPRNPKCPKIATNATHKSWSVILETPGFRQNVRFMFDSDSRRSTMFLCAPELNRIIERAQAKIIHHVLWPSDRAHGG